MASSVHKDIYGPVWPVGQIVVTVAGTPVNIMSVVDSTLANAPENATTSTTMEYTPKCNQIQIQGFKAGAAPPALTANTGNVYLVKKKTPAGAGDLTDTGTIVACITPGQTYIFKSASTNDNDLSPYEFLLNADNNNDAGQVTLLIC